MLKRIVLIATLALALGACGLGGSPTVTPPPPTNTPTPAPSTDAAIPPPPNGTEVKEGSDANLDTLIQALKPAIESAIKKENGKVDRQNFYTSTSSVADVAKFYDDAMKKNGWDPLADNNVEATTAALGYSSGDKGAVIFITDASGFGSSGTFVMTAKISK